jgi:hypothetical protein
MGVPTSSSRTPPAPSARCSSARASIPAAVRATTSGRWREPPGVVSGADIAAVGDLALSEGAAIHGLWERSASLEDVFFELTGEESAPS